MKIGGEIPDPAAAAANTADGARDPKIWKAAQDFEAMTLGQMLQPIFDTVKTADGFGGGGVGEQSFRPMLVTEMARSMERGGGIGLAGAIYTQMMKLQENKT